MTTLERRATISIASVFGFRMLGLFMVLPVIAIATGDYPDFTPLMLGVVLGAYGLTQAILQIPLGLLSDNIGRKPVIMGGLVVFILGSFVAAIADTMFGLMLGRALQGMGAIASTLMAMVTDYTAEQNRSKAMAMIGGSIGFSFILAMMLGPLVTGVFGLSGIFWLTAVLGFLGILVVQLVIPKTSKTNFNRESMADLQDISALLKDPTLQRLNVGVFALHFALMAVFIGVPSILANEVGVTGSDLPWVYLGLLGGGFFLMLPMMIMSEKFAMQKSAFLVAVMVMALSAFCLTFGRTSLITLTLLLLFFAAFNLLEASLPSWLSKACPVGNRGTAMGVYSTCQFLGAFAGGLIGGWSMQKYGLNGVFGSVACMLLVWWVFALGLQSPRPLKTLVLAVGDIEHQEFLKIISNVVGVEDILLVDGEHLAYVQVDRLVVDMNSLQPYLNR
ncbi:MAG TPA: MFS transporter [Porticoccaceae bacterium]|jgi:predicted MFS family arabinose efflux permease|nr:MFS transporter [Porticoccaceae bacterium]